MKIAEDQDTIGLRDLKNDSYPPSPLLCIKWWRICLDQPQSFKSNIDEIFKIVSCLKSAHKWVMPGSSIQESSKNLFSILKYFNVYPDKCRDYNNFIQFMKNETENTFIWFSKLIWYNSIKNINSELSLPKPIHVTHWLTFSKLEEFFHEQSKYSLGLVSGYIRNGEKSEFIKKLKDVDCKIKTDVVGRINSLIETCVVPLISSKDEVKINGSFSLNQKIDIRIMNLHADCNEFLHQYVSKIKLIANIYSFIPNHSKDTIRHYNMIFNDMEKYHNKQQLTIGTDYEIIGLINEFMTFLKENPDHEKYSARHTIPYLENLSLDFEANILNVHTNNILHDQKIVRLTLAETMKITEIDSLSCNDWWVHILKCISSPSVFLSEVKTTIDDTRKVGSANIINKLKSLDNVNSILTKWLTDTLLTRNKVLSTYKMLDERSNGFLIESRFTCTEAGCNEKNGNKCLFCELGRQLCYYQKFFFNNNIDIIDTYSIKYSRTESNQEQIISQHEILLKSLILCETNNIVTDDYLKTATERVKILNILKSEFLNILKLWSNLDKYNGARKLIIKAKLKITIDDVLVNIDKPQFSIKRKKKNCDVDLSSLLYLKSEIPYYLYRFQTTYARLLTLDKLNFVNKISAKCDMCRTIVEEYAILYCTHVLCSSCLIEAFKRIDSSRLICKLCRMLNSIKCLERVKLKQEPDAQLIGSYCTKLESIVNNLKKVIDLDESIKVMIFSSFEKTLDCLSSALSLNSINFMRLNLKEKNITTVLNTFQNSENMTTILINLQTGLNNLKLNFVTRVFFMDPIIDKSFENQIVDQICSKQIKQTYVHHFILKDTIEEKVANTFTYDDLSLGINVTLGQLSKLLKDEYNFQTD